MDKVRVVERVRSGRWKVEWVEPNPGLVDYVKSINIICPWADRRAVVRDEQRQERLREVSDRSWPGRDHPLVDAVDEALGATGEFGLYTDKGEVVIEADVIERVCERCGLDPNDLPDQAVSYVDRNGMRHVPFTAALAMAKAFAAAEPDTVLLHIDTTEREHTVDAAQPGNAYLLPLVERWKAGWALVRQWAGTDEQLARRDHEIDRLRGIIERTIWDLRRAGHPDLAGRLDRQLHGR